MNQKFKILWVFSNPKPDKIPSYVVSGIMPADYLNIQKAIFLKDHKPEILLKNYTPKMIIISKAFHPNVLELAKEAKKLKIKIISIFDDWNFIEETFDDFKRNELFKSLANLSDKLVVKTSIAANLIIDKIGLKANVIPDCLRYESLNCIEKIQYPFNISWFGLSVNHDTLIYGLKEIEEYNCKVSINIITNHIENLKKNLSAFNFNQTSFKFTEWSQNMHKEIIKSDIIIVPYINDETRIVKSQNRVTDSLNMGRFVIASKMPFLKEFQKYCYLGNIGEGLSWIKKNTNLAIEKTEAGHNHVKDNFNLKKIAMLWEKLINETL